MKKMTIALAVTLFLTMACITRKSEQGGVAPAGALDPASAKIYQTAQSNGNRLADLGSAAFEPFGQPLETQPCIFIDPTHTFQTLVGIGGALTDAAAETFSASRRRSSRSCSRPILMRSGGSATPWRAPISRAAIFPAAATSMSSRKTAS